MKNSISFVICPILRIAFDRYKLIVPQFYTQNIQILARQASTRKSSLFSGNIPLEKLQITYSRSSGAGGQNVNRVSSKVDVRFHVATADWLDNDLREALIANNKNRLTKDGYLIIKSEESRSSHMNLAHALEKIRNLISNSIVVPSEKDPETEAVIKKRLQRKNHERLMQKRNRSQTKSNRQSPSYYDL